MQKTLQIFFCLLFTNFIACDFGNTNIDPTRPTDAELKEILPSAITQTAHNLTSIGGRVTAIVIQQLKGIDAQPESYSQYLIDERTLDEFWQTGLYGGAMKDAFILIEKANEQERPHYKGIAQILMAINLGIATSFWGEVPYEEAFQGLQNLQPKYDSQEDIYERIQLLLQKAIQNLSQPASENPPLEDDLIFSGDAQKWIKTAKALQARYYLHLSKRDNNTVQKVLNALQSGVFQNLKDQPIFQFGNFINEAHPLPLYSFERPDQLAMSDYLYQLMDTLNDPRLNSYAFFKNNTPLIYHRDSNQLFWGQFDAPLPLISLMELKFIESEIHLRLGNETLSQIYFKEAVVAHFEQLNFSNAIFDNYINQHIHFDNQSTFDEKLEWLIQQKHIAFFAQNSIESWLDYRRTGFPQLIVPPNINSSFNPSMIIPRRYLYPISERTANEMEVNQAINRQNGQLLDVDIWAFE